MIYGNSFQRSSPIVLNLIIINALVFFAQAVFGGNTGYDAVDDLLALHHYKAEVFRPHQLITYMFMHGGVWHLIFNMLGLFMFGSRLERIWGPKRFLIFYLICGIVAGIAQLLLYAYELRVYDMANYPPEQYASYQAALRGVCTIGASGAVMGIMAAFGYLFPNTPFILFPIPVPVKAVWLVTAYIALDVFGIIYPVPGDNIAHYAHIAGALAGLLMVLYWNKTNKKTFY